MDEFTAGAFANRDEPVPLITVAPSDLDVDSSETESSASTRQKIRESLSPSRLKTKGQGLAATHLEKAEASPSGSRISLQDRLFAKVLQQVIPTENAEEPEGTSPVDRRSSKYVSRPSFSLPLMTNNFRRFNARIGIVFVFQNRLIRLFTWRTPTHTLSFLVTYTFVCLDPYLLLVLPLAVALLFVMVPAFTSRHPPPPPQNTISSTIPYYHQPYTGPALAPAQTIKPASETSKDFFRNMRDLQNSMADFSNLHDTLLANIAPATNFSDETFSSQVFLYLTILTSLSFITAHLLPWRFIFLVIGWATIVSSHPRVQIWLLKMQKRAETQTLQALNDPNLKHQKYMHGMPIPVTPAAIQSGLRAFSAIVLSSNPDMREVEVFELQNRPLHSHVNSASAAAEWQPYLFTPTPYDPLSPSRIAGDRPRGTRFFEDVSPPEGWEWAGKKWELDLEAGEWVNERLVVGVEYDVLHHDEDAEEDETAPSASQQMNHRRVLPATRRESVNLDFGGWVWDLPPAVGSGANRDDDLWLAYGDYNVAGVGVREDEKARNKKKLKKDKVKERDRNDAKAKKTANGVRDWEEATQLESRGRTGEWRRRRWVRMVKRQVIEI